MIRVFGPHQVDPSILPACPEISPARVLFGVGAVDRVGAELTTLGARRAFFVTSPGMLARPACARLRASVERTGAAMYVWPHVTPEPGTELIDDGARTAVAWRADSVIGMGGGSAMDAAKLIALLLHHPGPLEPYLAGGPLSGCRAPLLLVPTTAGSGSEVTADAVVTDRRLGTKRALKDRRLLGAVAVIDPLTTITCGSRLTAHCGLDALTHALEALTNLRATAASEAFAVDAIRLVLGALPSAAASRDDIVSREAMTLGALLAGYAFGGVGTAAVHACGYPLSGRHGVPHGLANGLMLPHVIAFNRIATDKYEMIEAALGIDDIAASAHDLLVRLGLPTRLRDLAIPRGDIPTMAEIAIGDERHLRVNPRRPSRSDLEAIFEQAW